MALRNYKDEIYPDSSEEINDFFMTQFINFMKERQLIWKRRYKKLKPRDEWTNDEILKKTKYTNVYRQLDKGTLWWYHTVGKEWLKSDKTEADNINLLWKTIIYRRLVKPDTFHFTGIPNVDTVFNPETFRKRLIDYSKTFDSSLSTNAFLTSGGLPKGCTLDKGFTVTAMYTYIYVKEMYHRLMDCDDGNKAIDIIQEIPYYGRFFAYEVFCDLCYLKDFWHFNINDGVNVGPGAIFGLRFIYPYTNEKKKLATQKIYEMLENQDEIIAKYCKGDFPYMNWLEAEKNRLSLRTIEHSLCEYGKYVLQYFSAKNGKKYGKYRLDFVTNADPLFIVRCDKSKKSGRDIIFAPGEEKRFLKNSKQKMKPSKKFKRLMKSEPDMYDLLNFFD
jgi:hypothetical protein